MADNEVLITINAKDNASPVMKKATSNLREMGEKISSLGMRISAVTTLPLTGLVVGLNAMGAAASKTVSDLKGNAVEIAKLDPAIRSLAKSYDELQAMVAPVQKEFQTMAATLLQSLVPVLKELMPTIKSIVGELGSLVKAFAEMPLAQKQTVLALIGIAAAVGPIITVFGQVVWFIGTIQTLLPGLAASFGTFGASVTAALGPVGLLMTAIGALIALLNSEAGKDALNSAKILGASTLAGLQYVVSGGDRQKTLNVFANASAAMGAHGTLPPGKAGGGPVMAGRPYMVGERGPEMFIPGQSGSISPNGGGAIIINYAPTIGAATSDDLEKIGYLVEQALRRRR